jgi:hypothetical protein
MKIMVIKSLDMDLQMQTLTFKEFATIRAQYPVHYVQNMYISIYKVGVNGCERSNDGRGCLDVRDGSML